ncbi:MAG: radical SAM protein [Clostridiales bacterium]|nr:radical SAM protein [Clostridiales bacterium]
MARIAEQASPRDIPLRLSGVVKESIVDGPQLRFVVFVQGCPHHCPGCHNPETWDPNGGFMTSTSILWKNITANPSIKGVTFSGGEPFLWGAALAEIARCAKARGMSVMTYSGWTYGQLQKKAESEPDVKALLSATDYLVDGPFILAERDLELLFRGSRNQRLLDVTGYPNTTEALEIQSFDMSGRIIYKE